MRRVFYANDRNHLFMQSISDIITLYLSRRPAASQPAIGSTHCAHHTVHRHTATRKYPGSDPQIDKPVPRPTGTRGFSPRPVLLLSPQCTTTTTALSTLYSTEIRSPSPSPVFRPAHLASITLRPPPRYKYARLTHPAPSQTRHFRSSPGNIIELEVSNPSPLLSLGPSCSAL